MEQLELFDSSIFDTPGDDFAPSSSLVFVIEEKVDSFNPYTRLLTLKPGIKEKNGTIDFDGIDSFDLKNLEEQREKILFHFQMLSGDSCFESFIPLIGTEDDCFYFHDYHGFSSIMISVINSFDLIYRFHVSRNDALYRPVLLLKGDGGLESEVSLPHDWFGKGSFFAFVDQEKKVLFYYYGSQDDNSEVLNNIFKNCRPQSLGAIKKKREKFQSLNTVGIYHLPEQEIREEEVSFVACVEVLPEIYTTRLYLSFNYGDFIYSFDNPEELFLLEESKDQVCLGRRNMDKESEEVTRFCQKLSLSEPETGGKAAWVIRQPGEEFLIQNGKNLLDAGFRMVNRKNRKDYKPGSYSYRVSSDSDWLDISVEIKDEGGESTPIRRSVHDSRISYQEDQYYIIREKDIANLSMMKQLGLTDSGELRTSRYNLGLIEEIADEIINNDEEEVRNLQNAIRDLRQFEEIAEVAPPADFSGNLRHYQQAGLNWLSFLIQYRVNGCLADDMGLGKTVQTLAFIQKMREQDLMKQALIVLPVSTSFNWEEEAHRFVPHLSVYRHQGPYRRKLAEELGKSDIILVSYQTLRNDVELFTQLRFSLLILDEAQNIKNPSSQTFRSVKQIKADHRISLTGTPLENSTIELWAQLDFLNPGLLGNFKDFKERFSRPIESGQGADEASLLRKLIFPFILRRKKEDVLTDLPAKEEITVFTEMNSDQRDVYNSLKEEYFGQVSKSINEKGVGGSSIMVFEALLKLRQAALFPELVNPLYQGISSCKLTLLIETLREILEEGHEVLIFSQFVKVLGFIKNALEEEGIKYAYLDGKTKNRSAAVKEFQQKEDKNVFLISLKAGGIGLNLTNADYVILFDPWWNPAVEAQAVDRCYRIGQIRNVFAYRYIVKETVEERIRELQEKKRNLMEDLITEEASFFKSLSKKDILGLFK